MTLWMPLLNEGQLLSPVSNKSLSLMEVSHTLKQQHQLKGKEGSLPSLHESPFSKHMPHQTTERAIRRASDIALGLLQPVGNPTATSQAPSTGL